MKKIHIEGMMCMHCVGHVKKALSTLDPTVEVSLDQKLAVVGDDVDDAAIHRVVAEAGYEVTGIDR